MYHIILLTNVTRINLIGKKKTEERKRKKSNMSKKMKQEAFKRDSFPNTTGLAYTSFSYVCFLLNFHSFSWKESAIAKGEISLIAWSVIKSFELSKTVNTPHFTTFRFVLLVFNHNIDCIYVCYYFCCVSMLISSVPFACQTWTWAVFGPCTFPPIWDTIPRKNTSWHQRNKGCRY